MIHDFDSAPEQIHTVYLVNEGRLFRFAFSTAEAENGTLIPEPVRSRSAVCGVLLLAVI